MLDKPPAPTEADDRDVTDFLWVKHNSSLKVCSHLCPLQTFWCNYSHHHLNIWTCYWELQSTQSAFLPQMHRGVNTVNMQGVKSQLKMQLPFPYQCVPTRDTASGRKHCCCHQLRLERTKNPHVVSAKQEYEVTHKWTARISGGLWLLPLSCYRLQMIVLTPKQKKKKTKWLLACWLSHFPKWTPFLFKSSEIIHIFL